MSKAVRFAMLESFGKSYEFFKEGLDIVTCDCPRGGWLQEYLDSNRDLFGDTEYLHEPRYEFDFVKAYILSYNSDKKNLHQALESIDRYLESLQDSYGYYVKGKILISLGRAHEALQNFELATASESDYHSRLMYCRGRTMEQFLEKRGLVLLFFSFLRNPLSACCCRVLRKYVKERRLELDLDENEDNQLLLAFNSDNDDQFFQSLFEDVILEELDEIDQKDALQRWDMVVHGQVANPVIERFINVLRFNSDLFLQIRTEGTDEDYDGEYDSDNYRSNSSHNPFYNDALDMDQQSQEFWNSL